MKRFRVRNGEKKDEFHVHNVSEIKAKTQGFIAKAITVTVLALLVFTAVCAAIFGKSGELSAVTTSATTLMGVVVGHYFKGR
jgi:hypothetical protein